MDSTHDARLLLDLLARRFDEAAARARLLRTDGGAGLVALARQTDVAPWLHALLEREGRLDLLGPAVEELARLRAKTRRDNLLLVARAEQALDLLGRAGIVPIALKGLDVLHRLYARFDERTLDDVDLLVRPEELREAVHALLAAGWTLPPGTTARHYIRSSHHLPLASPGTVSVEFELHWNLAQELRFSVDSAGLHARSLPLDVGGRTARRLADHDAAAHLLLHHFTHYFDRRLKWAVDLHALAAQPGFRWSEVVARVRAWGATQAAGAALRHLAKLFPAWIPDEALSGLPLAAWRRAVLAPLRSPHPLDLYRGAARRPTRLVLAAVLLERLELLPRWLWHRARRDARRGTNPLDTHDRGVG